MSGEGTSCETGRVSADAPGSAGAGSDASAPAAEPAPAPAPAPAASGPKHLGIVLAIYLLGLLVGGLYVGLVAPMRTVIQAQFGIDDATGIWMITIYTLFYAALIPVIGKLADRYGRKRIFVVCVAAFAAGAALCGASGLLGSAGAGADAAAVAGAGAAVSGIPAAFVLLLVGRVVQAVGACGLIPVANAEIGTSFPPEKRGMALGLAAAVSGLANVLGAAVGSLALGLVGNGQWPLLFFGCVPVCVLLFAGALVFMENHTAPTEARLDLAGSVLFVAFVLLLLLSIRSLDFFDLAGTLLQPSCWAPAVGAVACALVFRSVERRAADPIFHMEYFESRPIRITMAVSFFVGCVIISMTLVPEFAEAVTESQAGSGGYYMAAIGIFALAGPVIGGRLIDRRGPKPVLMAGFLVMIAGYLFLAFAGVAWRTPFVLIAGLAIVGLGMGFAMGAPTNYMILENTPPDESTAAVATIALVRQLGTSLAPAVYVGFIAVGTGLDGYRWMMLAVAASCVIAALLLLPYRSPAKE